MCHAEMILSSVNGGDYRSPPARGKAALKSCLEGPLPAPLNSRFTEQDMMVLFDNY